MAKDNKKELEICLDWLAFTTKYIPLDSVLYLLGIERENYYQGKYRAKGYENSMTYQDITVNYEGMNDNADTIHVVFSGMGCRYMEQVNENFSWQEFIQTFIKHVPQVKFTRIDLAIDDKRNKNNYSINQLIKKIKADEAVSKWKKVLVIEELLIEKGETTGQTLQFGSRQSEVMLRIYDKRLEQIKRAEVLPEDLRQAVKASCGPRWIRLELEFKKDKALVLANMIAQGQDLGNLAVGIMNHYVRFIDRSKSKDTNKARISTWEQWEKLIMETNKIQLLTPQKEKNLDRTFHFMSKQYKKVMAKNVLVFEHYGEINKIINQGRAELNELDYAEIKEYKEKRQIEFADLPNHVSGKLLEVASEKIFQRQKKKMLSNKG